MPEGGKFGAKRMKRVGKNLKIGKFKVRRSSRLSSRPK